MWNRTQRTPEHSSGVVCRYVVYDISVINELLSWFNTTLAPDDFKLPQVWMFIVATCILDGSHGIDKTNLAAPPLLVARLPFVHTVKGTTGYDGDSGHARGRRQHG